MEQADNLESVATKRSHDNEDTEGHFTDHLDDKQKIEVLKKMLDHLMEHLHQVESTANKITISVCTGLVVAPGLIVSQVENASMLLRSIVACFLVVVAAVTVWLLVRNRNHAQWLKKAVTRVEQALGMFRNDTYITRALLNDKSQNHWFDETRVLPLDGQRWGEGGWLGTQMPYILAVVAACSGGASVVLLA